MADGWFKVSNNAMTEIASATGNVDAFIVYCALLQKANEDGECWPSIAALAALTTRSDRHVQQMLKLLADRGFITVQRLEKGNVYTVNGRRSTGEQNSPGERRSGVNEVHRVNDVPIGGERRSPKQDSIQDPESFTVSNLEIDSSFSPTSPKPEVVPPPPGEARDAPAGFERFWAAYPSKIGKKAALAKWKQIKPDRETQDAMLAAIEAQRSSDKWRKGYIPNPATWLHQGRWEDEVPGAVTTPGARVGMQRMYDEELAALKARRERLNVGRDDIEMQHAHSV